MKTIDAISPAKVNLSLEVGKLDDKTKKHDVKTLMQTLTLHDNLEFFVATNKSEKNDILSIRNAKKNSIYGIKETPTQEIEGENLSIAITIDDRSCHDLKIDINENLITKALLLAAKESNFKEKLHIEVFLEKNIPAMAGLGGGSSNAAATLRAANLIFDDENLVSSSKEISTNLGSDVVFFLQGGQALMGKDGSKLLETHASMKNSLVILKPKAGVSTRLCYEKFDEMKCKDDVHGEFNLKNDLLSPACLICDDISKTINFLKENLTEAENVSMTGSGSACFGITKDFSEASKIACKASLNGYWAHACSCSSICATAKVREN